MKIRLIDFGLTPGHNPLRVHENDAGADVYMPYDCTIEPGEIVKIPLGFGLILPDGYAGFVFPRSSMAEKGLTCELPPVDSGYRGEIHAIISNVSNKAQTISKDTRVGQLVITPIIIADKLYQAVTGKAIEVFNNGIRICATEYRTVRSSKQAIEEVLVQRVVNPLNNRIL